MKSWELVNLVHGADIGGPASHKLLLSIIAAGTSSLTGVHVTSMERLAALVGVEVRAARKIVAALKERGLLHVVRNQWGGAAGTCPAYKVDAGRLSLLALKVVHTEGLQDRGSTAESCAHGGPAGAITEGLQDRHTGSLPGIQRAPVDKPPPAPPAPARNSRPTGGHAADSWAGGAARQGGPRPVDDPAHLEQLLAKVRSRAKAAGTVQPRADDEKGRPFRPPVDAAGGRQW